MAKPTLIWSNSQFNKKTYENLFYKKTFDKYVPIREKLISNDNKTSNNDNKTNGILPDLQSQNYTNIDNFKNIKSSLPSKNNLRSKSIDKAANPQQNKNSNMNTKMTNNKNNNNNINNTNDTSAFTHSSKKYFSPRAIYTQNYTEDLSNFRMGLLSAGSSCNNNIIIPMLPFRRPVSNFNFGVGQLWNNLENSCNNSNINNKENSKEKNLENNGIKDDKGNNNEEQIETNKNEINNEFSNNKRNYNIYNKVNSATRNNKPFKHSEMKKRLELFQSKNDINNLYIGMDKMINKLHKIKIEKGMMNSGIVNSLNKKFNRDYQNSKTSKTINIGNNNDKNKSSRSHSLNNKDNNLF